MRIAYGGIVHETNTYCSAPTPIDDFFIFRGHELPDRAAGARSHVNGFLDGCEAIGAEPVFTLVATAQPSGTILAGAYETMRDELLEMLKAAMPLDGVCLALHGAGVAEGVDDIELDIATRVREVVGEQAPIVGALDLHGNISQAFADAMDVFLGYRTYPHVDAYDRELEATRMIPAMLAGQLRPATHVETIPMLMPTSTTDAGYPAAAMNEVALEIDGRPDVIDCHVFHGFPYADNPLVGVHCIGVSEDREVARTAAADLARWIWDHRETFWPEMLSPAEAIERALEVEWRPVVINDTADNCGGGSPGDSTHVLRAMLEAGLDDACLSFMYDPQVVGQAVEAGPGATIDVRLGGKTDELHGTPIEATARVKALTDGRFRLRALGRDNQNYGRMARLEIAGIDVLVGSRRSQTFDPEVFRLHGIDVREKRIVVVKSSNHFRDGFRDIAARIITADSPGLTTLDVSVFPKVRAPGPLWPIDADATY